MTLTTRVPTIAARGRHFAPPATAGGATSVPHFGAPHTSVFYHDFEDSDLTKYVLHQTLGTVTIDGTVSHTGSKSCKMAGDNSGCQSPGTDANIGIERNCATLDGAWDSTTLTWYLECWEKFDVGYYDFNCGGEYKEFLIFRLPAGDSTGRASFIATKNGGPLVCPDFYSGDVVPAGTVGWTLVSAVETGTTKPVACTGDKPYYRQHLNQTSARPIDRDDGNWHNKVIKFRRESSLDAGDGFVGLWYDDVPALIFDGLDAGDLAFGQVYTRTTPTMRPFQYAGIINQHMSSAKSRWVDELRIYKNTDGS